MKKTLITESESASVESLGGGKYHIKIIQPGPGSSGLYLAENLAASVGVFKAGTQMYLDHPTETEMWDRPERSVRDLAAKFITDATVGDDGAIYTDIYVYPSFDQIIREKWEDIGVSINAWSYGIMGPNGEVPPFDGVDSVDFVTKAGAGGAILELLESARSMYGHENSKENQLDETKFNEFAESTAESFKGILSAIEAMTTSINAVINPVKESEEEPEGTVDFAESFAIIDKINEANLPDGAKARVIAAIESGKPVDEAIDTEVKYIEGIRESIIVKPDGDAERVTEAAPVKSFARSRKVK